jgi:hypothetical protein
MAHNRPQTESWTFTVNPDGSLCELKGPALKGQLAKPAALRGKIKGFSRGSRSRLLKAIGRLKQAELSFFVTATYPDDFPVTAEVWRRPCDGLVVAYPAAVAGSGGDLEKGIQAPEKRHQQERGRPAFSHAAVAPGMGAHWRTVGGVLGGCISRKTVGGINTC